MKNLHKDKLTICFLQNHIHRLLKEKQDHEEQRNLTSNVATASPAILSPSPTSIKSPPATQEEPEVIGAGLPLLQRLLLLKAKEEKAAVTNVACSQPTSPTSLVQTTTTTRASFSGPTNKAVGVSKNLLGVTQAKPKMTFRDRLKKHQNACSGNAKDVNKTEEINETTSEAPSKDSVDTGDKEPPWSKLKKAAIVRDTTDTVVSTVPLASSTPSASSAVSASSAGVSSDDSETVKTKPTLTLARKTKIYRSIDDLSPEYGGLPFVKKLKILNERQKLEELESVMKTRSFSLDIPDTQTSIVDAESLTRSQSEGSTMHQDRNLLTANLIPSSLNSSSESNETPERRNLKSILKKLTEDPKVPQLLPNRVDSTELRRLMRAPTIEGYAARHSKLSKSVTFNRDTLQSPPHSANVLTGSGGGSIFAFPLNSSPVQQVTPTATPAIATSQQPTVENGVTEHRRSPQRMQEVEEDAGKRQEIEKRGLHQIISAKTNHQMKLIKSEWIM